jgi:hypothetical protein
MTPLLTVNLLRVLFVTFCAAIGSNISTALTGTLWPGLLLGLNVGKTQMVIVSSALQTAAGRSSSPNSRATRRKPDLRW